jgi:hypothetical protein
LVKDFWSWPMELSKVKSTNVKFRAESLIREVLTNQARNIINADRKARIIIIVNVAVISIIISSFDLLQHQEPYDHMPIFVILNANAICLLLAMRSIGKLHVGKLDNQNIVNQLDYKHYLKNPKDEFIREMIVNVSDKRNVIRMALIEMYEQGQLLDKKNRYLHFAITSLGIGLVIAILVLASIKLIIRGQLA